MASVFSEVPIKGLRKAHFHQLMSYIIQRERDGWWYYGNKEQFNKRHAEIKTWVQGIIDVVNEHGVIIPK